MQYKNNILHIISPIPPSQNHYLAYRAIIKNGKPLAMSYKTPEAVKYRSDFADIVRMSAKTQNWNLQPNKQQHFYVDAIFYFDRQDKDPSNYWKILLDAITDTQLIWVDDNVVCERVQRIYYDQDNPRIELTIFPVDYIGVFNNTSQMETFVSNCFGCTRYSRNCSILRQAKEGRIQEDIADGRIASAHITLDGVPVRDMWAVPKGSTLYSDTPAPSNCMWDKVTKAYFENQGTGQFEIEIINNTEEN